MAFWEGLLGGDTGGLYDDLLTERQRSAINNPFSSRNLAFMSKAFADAATPSLTPKGGLGAALGNAAYNMAVGQDETAQAMLKAGLTSAQVAALKRQAALQEKVSPYYLKILEKMGLGGPEGTTPGVPTSPAPAVPRPPSYAPPVPTPPPPPGSTAAVPDYAIIPPFSAYPKGAGLLGGGTQTAGLPPQDEYIPPGGQSILDIIQASYGGGAGMPGSPFPAGAGSDDAAPTLRLASASRELNAIPGGVPFPTEEKPAVPPIGWQESWPPASAAKDVIGRTPLGGTAREVPPGRQRDPGQPGLPPISPLSAVSALADAGNRGERSLPPELVARMQMTGRGPVRVQPLGSENAPATRGAAGPFMPSMPDFRSLPGVSGGGLDTPIPGVGASPKELMAIDALAEMAKMGTPFKGLLESYYKTPQYLQDAARAAKMGTLPAEIFLQQFGQRSQYGYDLLKDMAKDNMTLDEKGNVVLMPEAQRLRTMNEEEKARVQKEWEARLKTTEVQVIGPNGPITVPMTEYDKAKKATEAQKRRAMVVPGSPYVPQIGDIYEPPALTEAEKRVQGIVTKEFEDVRAIATKVPDIVRSTHTLRRTLDSGIFTGLDANWNLFASKFGDAVGIVGKDTQDKIANTELYISEIGKETLELVKALKPASNLDIAFAERIAGRQTLSAGAIRKLLDLREELARLAIEKHNDLAKNYSPRAFEGGRRELPMPEPYVQKQGSSPGGYRWNQ